jgi:predicted HicB family RNase H-like nuclease
MGAMKYSEMTPEQKRKRNKANAASISRYNAANYDKILVRIKKDGDGANGTVTREAIQEAARRDNSSVNAWIIEAIESKL